MPPILPIPPIPPKWLTVRAAATPALPTEILIYDQIGQDWFGGDGISAKDFALALKDIPADGEILVCINSPGGNIWDGLAIANQLKQRRDHVTCRVDGVAASIASVIALAGKTVEMPENALLMIHEASGMAMGDAEVMREMAAKLDQHSEMLAGIYAEKTGKSREKMRALMRDETWFTGSQAQAIGLADTVTQQVKIAASFNLPNFRRPPAVLNTTNTHPTPPSPPAGHPNPPHLMNKVAILALLTQHGKPIAAESTDEQILAALSDLVTNSKVTQAEADALKKPAANVLIPAEAFKTMQAQVKVERERRITQEFRAIAADRPFMNEADLLPKCFADETLLASFKAMPAMPQGVEPLRIGIQNNGNGIIEDYRKMKPGRARLDYALANWHGLQEAHDHARIQAMSSLSIEEQLRRLQSPRAANTYSATLVTDRLSDTIITTIGTKLASLRAYSIQVELDRLKPRATVDVSKATAGATTQTNPTNFESGDSTTDVVQVTVNQYSQDFNVLNDELNKGHSLLRVAAKNAQNFCNKINDIVTAIMTVGNFGAATVIGAAASFAPTSLPPIYALAKNYGSKNLVLDGGHLAYLLPTDKFKFRLGEEGAFGFDLIAENNRWTGATANAVGFIADPNAIAIGVGLPSSLPASEFIELGTVELPNLGITVQVCHWFSRGGRVHWMSYDVMFGAAAGDTTAGEVLVTA